MAQQNYKLAEQDYMDGMKYKDIAEKYGVAINTVKSWKTRHGWSKDKTKGVHTKNKKGVHTKRGGQPGNKNATGPPKNKNAEKHGLFSKYLPAETMELVNAIQTMNPLDVLWDQITIQYAAIIRAQHIMYVKDIEDSTTTKIGEGFSDSGSSEKWEVQQAWDKQANFLQAQSRAMTALKSMLKQYDEMLHKNWEKASEEQKLRIEKLKIDIAKSKDDEPDGTEDDGFLEALKGQVDDVWQE